jgi:hypothetical protein
MSGHRNYRRLLSVAAVTVGFLAAGLPSATAHTHPTPIELAAPAVVYVEARAIVDVALIEHRQAGDNFGVHIGIIQSEWNPVLASSSGFVVDPTGVIVTTAAIITSSLDRAKVFAVNQAFHARYGAAAPLPSDPFARQHIGGPGDRNDQRLQACYPPNVTNDAGGCVVRATLDFVVYPYVTSQQRYGTLHAELLPGATKDVAVLRIRGANGMPTVAVAESAAGAKALSVIGFTGIPSAAHPLQEINQHLAQIGGSQLKTTGLDAGDVKDAARLKQALHSGMAGGPLVAERGQVIGLIPGPAPAGSPAPTLVGVATILQVLQKAGVEPHRGLVDDSFEAAMHLFKNSAYAASIPDLKKALELFPGHFMASQNLAVAQKHVASGTGTAAMGAMNTSTTGAMNTSTTADAGLPGWVWVGLVAGAVLVLAALAFLLLMPTRFRTAVAIRRRRQGTTDTGVEGSPESGHAGGGTRGSAVTPGVRAARRRGTESADPVLRSNRSVRQPSAAAPAPSRGRTGTASPLGDASSQARSPLRGGMSSASSRAAAVQQGPGAQALSAELRFCTACGGRLSRQHKYCGLCGEPVG